MIGSRVTLINGSSVTIHGLREDGAFLGREDEKDGDPGRDLEWEFTPDQIDRAIKTKQRRHQVSTYLEHRNDEAYALWWEMGIGKTKEFLDVVSHLHLSGRIDALLVLAPNAVAPNWLGQEIPPHLAVPYIGMHYRTHGSGGEKGRRKALMLMDTRIPEWKGKLRVLTMSYNSLITDRGFETATRFCTIYRTMVVADESTAIANPKTKTAKNAKKIGALCHYRWIGSGTPIIQSPFNAHSQVEFMMPSFWRGHGMRTREAFKSEFGRFVLKHVGGGRQVKALDPVEPFRRLDYLQKILAPISSRLLKEDSDVDLPPKVYTTRTFTMHPKQVSAYEALRNEYVALLDSGEIVEAPMALTRLMRLQQICSGFVMAEDTISPHSTQDEIEMDETEGEHRPTGRPTPGQSDGVDDAEERGLERGYEEWFNTQIPSAQGVRQLVIPGSDIKPQMADKRLVDIVEPGENPRLQLCLELVDEACHKVIVWCRFTRDVELLTEALGARAVRYDGKTPKRDRPGVLARFRDVADPVQVLVANVHTISQGVTLTIAKTVIYYSNSPSPEKRLQSEDRAHRIGQDVSIQIIDLVAEGTVDVKMIEDLVRKFDVAAQVMGDRWREWISLSPKSEED